MRWHWTRRGTRPTYVGTRLPPQFVQVLAEQLAEARESRMAQHVGAGVVQRARDVLDVDRVLARCGLEPERPERLEIALERHQVEAAPELLGVVRRHLPALPEREEERNQPFDLRLGESDVGCAQQPDRLV